MFPAFCRDNQIPKIFGNWSTTGGMRWPIVNIQWNNIYLTGFKQKNANSLIISVLIFLCPGRTHITNLTRMPPELWWFFFSGLFGWNPGNTWHKFGNLTDMGSRKPSLESLMWILIGECLVAPKHFKNASSDQIWEGSWEVISEIWYLDLIDDPVFYCYSPHLLSC